MNLGKKKHIIRSRCFMSRSDMHTDSLLCRHFADLMHTLCRVNVFHSDAAPRQAGPLSLRAKEQRWRCYDPHSRIPRPWAKRPMRAAGGASALLGEAAAAGGGCRHTERSGGGGGRHLRGRSAAISPTSSIGGVHIRKGFAYCLYI